MPRPVRPRSPPARPVAHRRGSSGRPDPDGPSRRDEDDLSHRLATPTENAACPAPPSGMPMKTSGAASRQHWPRFLQPDAGVDQDGHDARLEHGEDHREEVQSRPDHHDGPGPASDPDRPQAAGDLVAIAVELSDTSGGRSGPAPIGRVPKARRRPSSRVAAGPSRQSVGDVRGPGRSGRSIQPTAPGSRATGVSRGTTGSGA